jgi:hypothetical protein
MNPVYTAKIIHVTVKIEIADHADALDVIENCDYDFQHDDILRAEIVEVYDQSDVQVF